MPVPSPRNKILPARGNIADLQAGLAELAEGEICYAFDQDQYYQKEGGILVAVGATKAQGLLADSSLQPGDNISELYNDLGYVQAGDIIDAPVQSVNGKTGDVVLDSDDVGAPSDADFATLEGRVLANEVAHGNNLQKDAEQDGRLDAVEAKDVEQDGRLDSVESDIAIIDLALDSKADLVNGLIPTSQIPAIAITEFLGDVSSQAEMLALTGQPGDWCFRSDEGFGYVIVAEPSSSIDNWQQIATPGGDVNSVNGQTGTVVLSAADVGAIPATELPNLAPSTIDLQAVTDNGSTTTNRVDSETGFKSTGTYGFNSFSDSTGPIISVNNAAGNDPKVVINGDGSASFSTGKVNIGEPGHFFAKNTGNDSYFWANWTGPNSKKGIHVSDSDNVSNAKATIASDGSASFASAATRINSVGSVLVGTTSDLVTDAKIALDSGSGSGTFAGIITCLLYTSPSPRDRLLSRMPSSA